MAKTNALTGSQIAKFKGIELHGVLKQITDARGPRRVVHEFPYRDGGQVETLGRRPHRTQWLLTYTGPTWRDDFLELANTIDDSPSGPLVHPIYGQMAVVCEGFDHAAIDIVNATDTITFTLSFIEDSLDGGISLQQDAGTQQQAVVDATADLMTQVAPYAEAAGAAQALSDAAIAYAASAFAAASDATADPSLSLLLDSVVAATATATSAILADPSAIDTTLTYDALAAGELVLSACLDLADAVANETLGFEKFVVSGETSLAVVLSARFGPLAIAKYDQTLRLNPQVLDPTKIAAGTELVLPL